MNKSERSEIFDDLMEALESWDWTDSFELSENEGEAIRWLLERRNVKRAYEKQKYLENQDDRKKRSYQRYWKNKEALIKKSMEKA